MANIISSSLKPKIIGLARETLSENMSFLKIVNKDFSGASGQVGDTVNIGIPATLSTTNIVAANVPPAAADITNNSTTLTLDKFRGNKFAYTVKEGQDNELTSLLAQQIRESIRSTVAKVNLDLIEEGWTQTPYGVGNAGTGAFASSPDSLFDARKNLVDRNVDAQVLAAVLNTKDYASLGKLAIIQQANTFGTRDVIADANIPRTMGFDLYEDQQLAVFTKGTLTDTPNVSGAHAAGVTTILMDCTAGADAIALKRGDLINFGVAGENYALTADATIANGATGNILIDRPLETALAGAEVLTFAATPTHDANTLQNLAGDFSGLSMVARRPVGGTAASTVLGEHMAITEPNSGLTIDLAIYPQYHQTMWETSIIYGLRVTDSRKLTRIYSSSI